MFLYDLETEQAINYEGCLPHSPLLITVTSLVSTVVKKWENHSLKTILSTTTVLNYHYLFTDTDHKNNVTPTAILIDL